MVRLDLIGLCIVGLVCSVRSLAISKSGPQDVDSSFDGKLPIEWVHVGKAGSSFINTLAHIRGACPGLPEDRLVVDDSHWDILGALYRCNSSVLDTARMRTHHPGIESFPPGGYEAGKGHYMMFLRQPEQRDLSNYYYQGFDQSDIFSLDTFLPMHQGHMTKILTRAGGSYEVEQSLKGKRIAAMDRLQGSVISEGGMQWFWPIEVTRAEIETAKFRLRTGFSFIGITDQWDLSICLFNTMFNQPCRWFQFEDIRATKNGRQSTYDTAELNGWRDEADDEIYEVALEIFEANLKKYNVSKSSCAPCWREAGLYSA